MKIKSIADYLQEGGAEILDITNPYEVVRFKTKNGTHVVYTNKIGNKSYSDPYAKEAYQAYINGKKWIAKEKQKRKGLKYLQIAIKKRDGDCCFYCKNKFSEEGKPTIEHLLPLSKGGSNGIANLALAHEECNLMAADLDIVEKVRLRERM